MMDNPFIRKAQDRKSRHREIAMTNLKALAELHARFTEDSPAKQRIALRVEEAREVVRHCEGAP